MTIIRTQQIKMRSALTAHENYVLCHSNSPFMKSRKIFPFSIQLHQSHYILRNSHPQSNAYLVSIHPKVKTTNLSTFKSTDLPYNPNNTIISYSVPRFCVPSEKIRISDSRGSNYFLMFYLESRTFSSSE